MLEAISTEEAGRHDRALEVRYRKGDGSFLVVSMVAHDVDGTAVEVWRWEFVLIVVAETMTAEAMRVRAEAEATRRAIGRVKWIEEV